MELAHCLLIVLLHTQRELILQVLILRYRTAMQTLHVPFLKMKQVNF